MYNSDIPTRAELPTTGQLLRSTGIAAWILMVLTVATGLGAAGAVAWGVNQRRKEYA